MRVDGDPHISQVPCDLSTTFDLHIEPLAHEVKDSLIHFIIDSVRRFFEGLSKF